jgi:hypothetical protein
MLPIENYLFLSLALFIIGVIGVVTRRNVIVMAMSPARFSRFSSSPMPPPKPPWLSGLSSRFSAIAKRFWKTKWIC